MTLTGKSAGQPCAGPGCSPWPRDWSSLWSGQHSRSVRSAPRPTSPRPRPTNGSVVTIEQGTAYDAEDLRTVMANTDTVFVGTVTTVTGRDEDAAWTTFTVAVIETIAGQPTDEITIRQHGYVDRQGTVHIIENQALVEVGRTYMFATNEEPSLDVYTVAPGPWSARPTEPEGQPTLVKRYHDAR